MFVGSGNMETTQRRIRVLCNNYYQYQNGIDQQAIADLNNPNDGEKSEQYRQIAVYGAVAFAFCVFLLLINIFTNRKKTKEPSK